MDQKPEEETVTEEANNPPKKEGIDPRSFLLPKKEVHAPENAQRINAAALLEQESNATLPEPPPLPPPPPVAQKEKTSIEPLETYQSDIQKYIREKNVSNVTVAAAESDRRHPPKPKPPLHKPPPPKPAPEFTPEAKVPPQAYTLPPDVLVAPPEAFKQTEELKTGSTITRQLEIFLGGLALIVVAGGIFAFAYIHSRALPAQTAPVAPFIAVDETKGMSLQAGESGRVVMTAVVDAKNQVKLSVGLVAQLLPTISTTTGEIPLDAETFLAALAPNIPPQLLRTVAPHYLLGVHSFDINQPFLIFSVDSYEGGYAGMLAWEGTMQQDLSPLFAYTPTPKVAPQPTATSTATTSVASTSATSTSVARILSSTFVDSIIENHDARVLQDGAGDVVFLWTFLDHSTVLITTNPNTVHEIISRLKTAPTITTPGR